MCCEAGGTEIFDVISQDEALHNLSLGWALRFDAIKDPEFIAKAAQLSKTQMLGILLEVTPGLASASGVMYKGNSGDTTWHSARQVFLVGYTQAERKLLIDTVFDAFYMEFGFYPAFTVAWMIDSWSLDYLRNTYGVRVHELTKEQYETDSYTLYGGIFNLPYFPQKTHPLLPGKKGNSLDLLILRQTVSDIEKNYGSYQSFYTSQPNDYLANPDKTDFNYFDSLIRQADMQDQENRFVILGIENSQEWVLFKDEYLRQLKLLAEKVKSGEVVLMSPLEIYNQYKNRQPTVYRFLKSEHFPQAGVLWFWGENYRARLETWPEGLVLTDLRVYADTHDPYTTLPLTTDRGYWIVPYVLDSSQQFTEISMQPQIYRGNPIRQDQNVARFGWLFSSSQPQELKVASDVLSILFPEGEVVLHPQHISINGFADLMFLPPATLSAAKLLQENQEQYVSFTKHPRFYFKPTVNESLVVGWENEKLIQIPLSRIEKKAGGWDIVPHSGLTETQINDLSSIFQPDRSPLTLYPDKTTLYWHNTEAIAGRSPVRLYIDARNVLTRPVPLRQFSITLDTETITATYSAGIESGMEPFFIDFTSQEPGQGSTQFSLDGNVITGEKITFYKDCSENIAYCVSHPDQLQGFINVSAREYQDEIFRQWQIVKSRYIPLIERWFDDLRSSINFRPY